MTYDFCSIDTLCRLIITAESESLMVYICEPGCANIIVRWYLE